MEIELAVLTNGELKFKPFSFKFKLAIVAYVESIPIAWVVLADGELKVRAFLFKLKLVIVAYVDDTVALLNKNPNQSR